MESSSSAGGWHWLRGLWPLSGSDLLQILVVTKGVRVAWIPTLGPRVLWGHFPWRPSGPTCRCHPTQPQWLNLFQHFKTPPQNQPPYAYYLFKMIPATSTKPLLDSPEQVLFPLPRTFFVYILTWLTYNNPSSSSWKVTSPRKPFLNSTPPPPPPVTLPTVPSCGHFSRATTNPVPILKSDTIQLLGAPHSWQDDTVRAWTKAREHRLLSLPQSKGKASWTQSPVYWHLPTNSFRPWLLTTY